MKKSDTKEPLHTLEIHLRNGNVITLTHVADWTITERGNELVGFKHTIASSAPVVRVANYIALSEVAAIVTRAEPEPLARIIEQRS